MAKRRHTSFCLGLQKVSTIVVGYWPEPIKDLVVASLNSLWSVRLLCPAHASKTHFSIGVTETPFEVEMPQRCSAGKYAEMTLISC